MKEACYPSYLLRINEKCEIIRAEKQFFNINLFFLSPSLFLHKQEAQVQEIHISLNQQLIYENILDVLDNQQYEEQIDSYQQIVNFIKNVHPYKLLLLFGYRGSGKSIIANNIAKVVWRLNLNKKETEPHFIPIFISQPYQLNNEGDIISQILQSEYYSLDQDQIEDLKSDVKNKNTHLIVIFDEQTQINSHKALKIYKKIRLQWPNIKVIFTIPNSSNEKLQTKEFVINFEILPFTQTQQRQYKKVFFSTLQNELKNYFKQFTNEINLDSFLEIPYFLRIVLLVFLNIGKKNYKTQYHQYDDFMTMFLQQEAELLQLTKRPFNQQQFIQINNFSLQCISMGKFFPKNLCCPESIWCQYITQNQLIFDFYRAKYINEQIQYFSEIKDIEVNNLNRQELKNLQNIASSSQLKSVKLSDLQYYGAAKLLIAICWKETLIQKILYRIIQLSSVLDNIEQEAGNAFFILKCAQYCFDGQSFEKIRIKNADISGTKFRNCNFQNSIMDNVNLYKCEFFQCNLNGANWRNVTNIEYQKLNLLGDVSLVVFSQIKNLLAVRVSLEINDEYHCLIQILNSKIGKTQNTLKAKVPVDRIEFSFSGQLIAGGYQDQRIRLWNKQFGKLIKRIDFKQNLILKQIFFSPKNEKYIILLFQSGDLMFYNIFSSISVDLFKNQQQTSLYCSPTFSNKDSDIAFQFNDQIKIYSFKQNSFIAQWTNNFGTAQALSFSLDDRILVSQMQQMVSKTSSLILWYIKLRLKLKQIDCNYNIFSLKIINQETIFALARDADKVILINANQAKYLQILKLNFNQKSLLFQNNTLVEALSYGDQSEIKLWNLKAIDCQQHFKYYSGISSISLSSSSNNLAFSSKKNNLVLYELKSRNKTFEKLLKLNKIFSISLSDAEDKVAVGGDINDVQLICIETGKCLELVGHKDWVFTVTFSPDDRYIASGSGDSTVILWDSQTGKELHKFIEHQNSIFTVQFSLKSKILASGSADSKICVWSLENFQIIKIIKVNQYTIQCLAFSQQDELASAHGDGKVRIWDSNFKQKYTCIGHKQSVNAVIYILSGRFIASGSDDWTINIWDTFTGSCKQTLSIDSGVILSLAFSKNQQILFASTSENKIHQFKLSKKQTFQEISIFDDLSFTESIKESNIENIECKKSFVTKQCLMENCHIVTSNLIDLMHK